MRGVVAIVVDRRHVERSALRHFGERRVVQSIACSTDVGARAHGVASRPRDRTNESRSACRLRCAASTAAFISSKVNVSLPVTSAPLPVEPYILI